MQTHGAVNNNPLHLKLQLCPKPLTPLNRPNFHHPVIREVLTKGGTSSLAPGGSSLSLLHGSIFMGYKTGPLRLIWHCKRAAGLQGGSVWSFSSSLFSRASAFWVFGGPHGVLSMSCWRHATSGFAQAEVVTNCVSSCSLKFPRTFRPLRVEFGSTATAASGSSTEGVLRERDTF